MERLLRAVVSQDIMSIVQKSSVVDSSNLQTELEQLENENVGLEFQVLKYAKEYAHLRSHNKTLFDSIKVNGLKHRLIDALQDNYMTRSLEIAKLRAELCDRFMIKRTPTKYVNGMKYTKKNKSANVSNIANQTKHKAHVWKPKNVGSKERLASPMTPNV
ncbi:hypothetical protein Tco_1491351 [Tanacetum coccineum]